MAAKEDLYESTGLVIVCGCSTNAGCGEQTDVEIAPVRDRR